MKEIKTRHLILLFFCLLFILHHLVGYVGHYGYDDMRYAELANDLNNGKFNPGNHFSFRITLVGLTALSYRLFGINDFASAMPSLLASIATLFLVFIILRKEKNEIITIGLSFFSLNLWGMFYSDKLMPDALITFFSFLCIFSIYLFKFRKRDYWYAFIAALALFLAFNTKGNIVLLFPLLAYLFIVDAVLKRDLKFWFLLIGSSFFLLVSYFIFYHFVFGNALIRFKSITQNSYLNLCSYSDQPFSITLQRIGYKLLLQFISHALFTGFLFIFTRPKQIFSKKTLLFDTEKGFFVIAAIVLLLSSNFMSISLSGYSPMCLDPRHYLFIVPVAGIAATFLIRDYLHRPFFLVLVLILTLIVFGIALVVKANTSWLLYLPLIVVLLLSFILNKTRFNRILFSLTLFIALSVNLVQVALYANNISFRKQEKIFQEKILALHEPAVVFTNAVQKNLGYYLNGFKDTNIKILSYDEFNASAELENKPIYLFKNYYTRYLSSTSEKDLPPFAQLTDNYQKIYENNELNIQIFIVDSPTILKPIVERKNNFEGTEKGWSNYEASNKIVYSGSQSSLLGEYSSTLKLNTDTLNLEDTKQVIISASFQIYLMEESNVSFVISSDIGFWKGINFQKQIKAYGNWMPVTIVEIIDVAEFPPGDVITLYIWNPEQKEVYIDNLAVELSVLKQQKVE